MLAVSILALIFVALVVGWFILPFGLRKAAEARLARLCKAQKAIVLSYDDGPSHTLTPRLLDLLCTQSQPATFFVIGRNAEANNEVVARAVREGHEVGSHTFNHNNAWKVGPLRAARDLAAGIRTVGELGGDKTLFRPPYGKLTLATLLDCFIRQQRFGWWTIDCKDTWAGGNRWEVDDVLEEIAAQGGGVILLHDSDRAPDPDKGMSHADYVLALTAQIIEFAEEHGYRVMRLGDVLGKVA